MFGCRWGKVRERKRARERKEKRKLFSLGLFGYRKKRKQENKIIYLNDKKKKKKSIFFLFGLQIAGKRKIFVFTFTPSCIFYKCDIFQICVEKLKVYL